jgi:hypothetical protein
VSIAASTSRCPSPSASMNRRSQGRRRATPRTYVVRNTRSGEPVWRARLGVGEQVAGAMAMLMGSDIGPWSGVRHTGHMLGWPRGWVDLFAVLMIRCGAVSPEVARALSRLGSQTVQGSFGHLLCAGVALVYLMTFVVGAAGLALRPGSGVGARRGAGRTSTGRHRGRRDRQLSAAPDSPAPAASPAAR